MAWIKSKVFRQFTVQLDAAAAMTFTGTLQEDYTKRKSIWGKQLSLGIEYGDTSSGDAERLTPVLYGVCALFRFLVALLQLSSSSAPS